LGAVAEAGSRTTEGGAAGEATWAHGTRPRVSASPLGKSTAEAGGKYGGKYDGCYFNRADPELAVFDTHLVSFLGPDGLMRLLAMIAEEEVPISEGFEMLKRLHIPGYEHTRLHFEEAIRDGVFELNTDPGYYWQADIRAVDQWLKKKKHF
jgi:hypothetical protein